MPTTRTQQGTMCQALLPPQKDAARATQAWHRVPSPMITARHNVPSNAAAESGVQTIQGTARPALPLTRAQPKRSQVRHGVPGRTAHHRKDHMQGSALPAAHGCSDPCESNSDATNAAHNCREYSESKSDAPAAQSTAVVNETRARATLPTQPTAATNMTRGTALPHNAAHSCQTYHESNSGAHQCSSRRQ